MNFDFEIVINIIYLFVCLVTIIMSIVVIMITTKKDKSEMIKEKKYDVDLIKLMLTDNIVDNVNNMLDNIIKEAINLYLIFNSINEETYINNDIAKELEDYTFGMVKNKLTPTVKDTLGLIYDISTKEKLDSVIKLRIKIHVINFMVEQNQDIE